MKKTKLYNDFTLLMYGACSTADVTTSTIQRQILIHNGYTQELLGLMDDHEARWLLIKVVFVKSVNTNILDLCETQEEYDKKERKMWDFIKEWDEL